MRWVIIGGNGMLGTDLTAVLRAGGEDVASVGRPECDIRELDALPSVVAGADVVVNAAAWTGVDDAELHEPSAFAVNALGARNVAIAARAEASRLIHISTDYVFDGNGPHPYATDRPQHPVSAYGRTKVAGEWAVRAAYPEALVVRTAWLYGDHGPNFVKAMLNLASEQETLRVVDDQVGQPTWTCDLAGYLVALGRGGSPGGYYHGTNGGEVSRYDFARTIFSVVGLDPMRIVRAKSSDFPNGAPRPAYSALEHDPNAPAMPTWSDAIHRYLRRSAPNGSIRAVIDAAVQK